MMIGTTAVLCGVAVLAQDKRVSIEIEPMTVERALAKISAESGMRLAATASMENAVVQVSVTDVEPEALLSRLAQVVGGTWRAESDGTMRLYDNVENTRKLEREALAARTKKFEDEIAERTKALNESGEFDPAKFQEQAGFRADQRAEGGGQRTEVRMGGPMFDMASTPGGRAIVRALGSMNARDLAAVGEGQRVVFSSAPTAMQKRMGGNPLRDAQAFLAEEEKFRSLMPRRGPGGRPGEGGPAQQQQQQQQPTIGKIFLVAYGEQDGVRLDYFVASTTGEIIGRGFLTLGTAFPGMAMAGRGQVQGGGSTDSGDGLQVSDAAKAAAKAMRQPGWFGAGMMTVAFDAGAGSSGQDALIVAADSPEAMPTAATESLITKLTKPDQFDPLSLFAGEAIRAATGDTDVVACLPDSLLSYAADAIARGTSVKDFVGGQQSPLSFESKDGWTLIAPKNLLRSRAERADRGALGLLAERSAKNGVVRLADLAAYSLKAPVFSGGVDTAVVTTIDPGSRARFADVYGDSRAALQVFGRLQGPDFSALQSGIGKPLVGISGASQAVAAMVYNSGDGPQVQRSTQFAPGQGDRNRREVEVAVQVRGGGGPGQMIRNFLNRSMLDERTEILPTGVPGGTMLQMSTSERAVLYALTPGGGSGRYTTAGELGREAAMRELIAQTGANLPPFAQRGTESLAPTTETRYTMTFLLAPNVTMTRTLVDPAKADTASATALNLLPEKYRLEYQNAYSEAKSMMEGRGGRMRGGNRGPQDPPPPSP